MQSNYDGSTHRRHKVTKSFSSYDPLNPEHKAIGRVPWVNSIICINTTAELLIASNTLVTGKTVHVTGNRYQRQAALRPSLVKVSRSAVGSTSDRKLYTPVTGSII
jgi:hypothetical protein